MYYSCYMDIVAQGVDYLDAFIRDYYVFIKRLDAVISLDSFAKEWKCIPSNTFGHLKAGDIVYTRDNEGDFYKMRVISASSWVDEEEKYAIEAEYVDKNNGRYDGTVILYNIGEAYCTDSTTEHTPTQYRFKYSYSLSKGDPRSWPIKLITTKTKEPTS